MNDDFNELARKDLEKVSAYQGQGLDTSLPAMIELGFGSLTALVAICWFVAMYWVPDPIPGTTWFGVGMVGLVLFGLPAGTIFVLRRGGADVVRAIAQSMG